MSTRQRQKNAPSEQSVPIAEAAPSIGYASETLRRYMWMLPEADQPPLHKGRGGRWYVRPSELAAWATARDAAWAETGKVAAS